ncbi:protein of unknown function [Cardinium endosymbiont cEper1 of Encarsia pergandiella]|nr:protein of unknown function [Cardinium endosymbiont cEper1 of Encarsia pergandiella]
MGFPLVQRGGFIRLYTLLIAQEGEHSALKRPGNAMALLRPIEKYKAKITILLIGD